MNSYEKLASVLDTIPNGYPEAPDGSHLKILEWIFTPEEAELASQLKLRGETVDEIAARLNRPVEGLSEFLDTMHEKGQINSWQSKSAGARKYGLMPFAVGIYEEQLNRMDGEFAKILEDYFETGFKEITATEPVIFQVIPVNQSVNAELEIHPYEKAEQIIESSASWGVRECICKKQKMLVGEPCSYPTAVCLIFATNKENAFDDNELTKPITKEESLKLLRETEDAGLIHCSYNVQSGHQYICNCCTCCCGVLRGVENLDNPREYIKTDFVMTVDADLCTGCETCVDRCQFGALSIPEDIIVVDANRCIGCGVCAVVCPENALELTRVESPEKPKQPTNQLDWMTQRAMSRGVDPSDIM
ncbi:MAG: ATP-binding protein [Candidatus Thorarchaeota archaeon]|jgi:Na+-translocating ferredoxin:NAD+ oxidoreductase RNF subunit RnfB